MTLVSFSKSDDIVRSLSAFDSYWFVFCRLTYIEFGLILYRVRADVDFKSRFISHLNIVVTMA